MSNGDVIIPPTDLTTATIQAINLILSQFGLSPLDQILGLFSGKPKFDDTLAVIAAYNQSAYWPLHALAADMQIWVKNGAPISDSNPAVQATFGAAKQGTVESIQELAGEQPGPNSPGYWTIFALIQKSWELSGYGETEVIQTVRALDALTQVLTQANQKPPTTPPPPGTPPPGTPPPVTIPPCDSGDPNADEILDLCNAVNGSLAAILAALNNLAPGQTSGAPDACCIAVVNKLTHVIRELTIIATALTFESKNQQAIDLTPITVALQALATAAAEYPPIITALKDCVCTNLSAIAKTLGPDLGKVIQNIADAINKGHADDLLPAAMVDEMVKNGSMPAPIAQFFSDRPASWSISGLLSGIGHFIAGPINPDLGAEMAANIKAVKAGQAPPFQPVHSLLDIPMYILALVGSYWSTWAVDLAQVALPAAENAIQQIGTVVTNAIPGGAGAVPPGVGAPAVAALNFVKGAPPPGELITVDNYVAVVQDAMGRAGLMGMTAWAAAMVGGFLLGPWEKYWGEVAAMIATAAGFEEITARALGPFLDAIIRNRAIQDANRNWPTRVPPGPQGLALFARRKISQAQADQLQGFAGLDPDWRPPMYEGAYRPLQPRVVVNAFLDQPIDRPTLLALLEDAALSPVNVQTMADAIIYKSIANVRNSYLSALIAGYGKGIIADQELSDALTQFNFSAEAKQYVTAHVLILRREVLATEAEKTVVPLVANGNITPDEGLQQLEAAGVQSWYAELQITLATTRATIHAAKLEAAAERKAELARQRNLTRAAVAEFQSGAIDEAALTAALIALGLDASLVASIVAVQTATRQGRLRLVYGQLLSPADAKLLTEKVAAIAQQTKDQLITLDQARAQLAALSVDQAEAEALVARWAATLKKSPGADVYQTP